MAMGIAIAQMAAKAVDEMVNVGSTYFANQSNRHAQRRAYEYASRLQQQAMDWQEMMSSTAHQREMDDLRKAGLNPLLTATGGSGAMAYSAGGATPVSQNQSLQADSDIFGALSTAKQLKMQEKQTDATVENLGQQTENLKSEQKLTEMKTLTQEFESQIKKLEKEYLPKEQERKLKVLDSQVTLNTASALARKIEANSSAIQAETARQVGSAQKEKLMSEKAKINAEKEQIGKDKGETRNYSEEIWTPVFKHSRTTGGGYTRY